MESRMSPPDVSSTSATMSTPADGARTRRVPAPEIDVAASPDTGTVLRDVVAERMRQDRRWGEQNHPPGRWLAILAEEVGEVARATLAFDDVGYRAELLQAAAVCVAAIESLDRAARRRALAGAREGEST